MKTIRIKELTIENFRGQSGKYEFGEYNEISGRNECGKSTIKNAFLWLLTGADEDDMANKDLFDRRITQTKETSVPAVVTGIFDIDGNEVELKRTAKIGWTRRRGNETYKRKGTDDYTFSIDNIDRSATDYKQWIEVNFAPVDKLKCMINIMQFTKNISDWKAQRKLLSDIVGEITKYDFTGDYTELYVELEKYTPEEVKERLKNKLAPLKAALGSDNKKGDKVVELEVLQSQLLDEVSIISAERTIAELKEQRTEIQKKINGKRKEIEPLIKRHNEALRAVEEKEMSVYKLRRDFQRQQDESLAELAAQVRNAEQENAAIVKHNKNITTEYNRKKQSIADRRTLLAQTENRLNALREENLQIKNTLFNQGTCAYCGQKLPVGLIEQLKADFEEKKAMRLSYNIEQGKQIKFQYDTEKADIESLEREIAKEPILQPLVDAENLQLALAKAWRELPVFEDSEAYKEYLAEVNELKENIPELPQVDTAELNEQLNAVNSKIDEISEKCGERRIFEKQKEQIAKAQQELQKMSAERATLEKIEQQLKDYEEEKANIIGDRVNCLLKCCHVDMFTVKKDGELAPNCEVKMSGVGKTMNTASEIIAGIDISNAFCKHYDVLLPLFVEGFEVLSEDNMVHIWATERQLVTMRVNNENLTFKTSKQ